MIGPDTGALGGDLHIFDYEGRDILYQVDTGLFFEIDSLARDILTCAGVSAHRQDIIAELSSRYDLDLLVGAVEEFEGMDVISLSPTALCEGPELEQVEPLVDAQAPRRGEPPRRQTVQREAAQEEQDGRRETVHEGQLRGGGHCESATTISPPTCC